MPPARLLLGGSEGQSPHCGPAGHHEWPHLMAGASQGSPSRVGGLKGPSAVVWPPCRTRSSPCSARLFFFWLQNSLCWWQRVSKVKQSREDKNLLQPPTPWACCVSPCVTLLGISRCWPCLPGLLPPWRLCLTPPFTLPCPRAPLLPASCLGPGACPTGISTLQNAEQEWSVVCSGD